MKVVPMKAERRTALGRNQLASLRREGWMPAVLYGEGGENVSLSISEWELGQHVKAHHKVFALDIDGASETALLQEVAWHTLNDRPLHADFRRIDLNKPIQAKLEVTLIGHPVGLGKGGVLVKDHMVIDISCLPAAMPEGLEHDIGKLEVGDGVRAADLALPEGVQLVTEGRVSICRVVGGAPEAAPEGETEPGDAGEPGDAPAAS